MMLKETLDAANYSTAIVSKICAHWLLLKQKLVARITKQPKPKIIILAAPNPLACRITDP